MAKLCQKLVVIVAAHQVMRHGHADGRRGCFCTIGPGKRSFQPLSHDRDQVCQPPDDVRGLDVYSFTNVPQSVTLEAHGVRGIKRVPAFVR